MANPQDIVAFDLGTSTVRCGSVAEPAPTVSFANVVGKRTATGGRSRLLKKAASAAAPEGPTTTVGDEALDLLRQGAVTELIRPMESAAVKDWDAMEKVLAHAFEALVRPPSELSVVLPVPPYNPTADVERIAQLMFETFQVERFATVPQGLCALYASGRTTGIVLDVGHGTTTVTPVFDSYPIDASMARINFGGADVSDHLKRLMYERGFTFSTPVDLANLECLKDGVAMVVPDYQAALAADDAHFERQFELPDGAAVTVAKERFRCSEILFDPMIIHNEAPGLGAFLEKAIKASPIDTRRALSSSIVVTGGTSQMPGFGARLQDDVARRFPGMFGSVHVIEPKDRTMNVWSGAAVLANMPTFSPYFVTQEVYDEHGPSIVHNYFDHDAAARDADEDDDAPPPPPPDDD